MMSASKNPISLPLPQLSHLVLFLVALGIATALTFAQKQKFADLRQSPDYSQSAPVSYSVKAEVPAVTFPCT